jgi:hypothetical protein
MRIAIEALVLTAALWTGASIAQREPDAKPAPPPLASGAVVCRAGAKAMTRLELVFGMSRKDGTTASEQDWQTFVDDVVTPRFPDGLTILTGYGQWRGGDGAIVRETSRVLLIWHTPHSETESMIEAIRAAWKSRQNQDSVLRAESQACVRF